MLPPYATCLLFYLSDIVGGAVSYLSSHLCLSLAIYWVMVQFVLPSKLSVAYCSVVGTLNHNQLLEVYCSSSSILYSNVNCLISYTLLSNVIQLTK
jgi:hypothetical protein